MSSTRISSGAITQLTLTARQSTCKNVVKQPCRALSAATIAQQQEHQPQVIFSGIQPTGIPHLGNYLGALSQWTTLQHTSPQSTTLLYCLVDLHAITLPQPPAHLRQWKRESLAILLALGLDPARSILFNQSDVPAHSELFWILSCQASTGYLSRMTQWKDKTTASAPKAKLGLFAYPVLMAADVLLHRTTHVPVGHDQAQHLEFARELANGFNAHFAGGERVLHPPETVTSPAKRIMSLTDPKAKMSKSSPNPKSRIVLTDDEKSIREKLRTAITDDLKDISYDPDLRPGISNLIDILYHISTSRYPDREALAKDFEGATFKTFKLAVGDAIEAELRPIRESYEEVIRDEALLERVARQGAEKARESAEATMREVRKAVGLAG